MSGSLDTQDFLGFHDVIRPRLSADDTCNETSVPVRFERQPVLTLDAHHLLQSVTFNKELLLQNLDSVRLGCLVFLNANQRSCDLRETLFDGRVSVNIRQVRHNDLHSRQCSGAIASGTSSDGICLLRPHRSSVSIALA
jgi:hypothetical protein